MKSKVVIISCYFGRLPNYFPLWIESCANNREFDWLVFTNEDVDSYIPYNVRIVNQTFDELKKLIERKVDFPIDIQNPYKLCDFKPLYGIIFSEFIKGYTHWGHCDLDIIWGDLSKFVTDDMLEKYDRVFNKGHLSIYKNTDIVNHYYKKGYTGINYRILLESPFHFGFDESKGLDLIYHDNLFPMASDSACADINYRKLTFEVNGNKKVHDYFEYTGKELWGCDKNERTVEYSYIHLQKRKMKCDNEILYSSRYYIFPDRFSLSTELQYNVGSKIVFSLNAFLKETRDKIKWNYHWKIKWMRR